VSETERERINRKLACWTYSSLSDRKAGKLEMKKHLDCGRRIMAKTVGKTDRSRSNRCRGNKQDREVKEQTW